MSLVNLTPHDIDVLEKDSNKVVFTIPRRDSTGIRREEVRTLETTINDEIQIYQIGYKDINGLPPSERGVFFIVSMLIAQSCPERNDLVFPGEICRDSSGKILGCYNFSRLETKQPHLFARWHFAVCMLIFFLLIQVIFH
jgi:hypothetical protein